MKTIPLLFVSLTSKSMEFFWRFLKSFTQVSDRLLFAVYLPKSLFYGMGCQRWYFIRSWNGSYSLYDFQGDWFSSSDFLFERANINTSMAFDAFLLIKHWVIKSFFIRFHANCVYRAYHITCSTATAFFFFQIKYREIFHFIPPV